MEENRTMPERAEPSNDAGSAEVAVLARRARAGDRMAYGELFRRFWPAIHAVVLGWLHDPVEADDVAQDVFLHGMRKLPQLRDARCFAGWLRQIAVRLALNRLSRRRPVGAGLAGLVNVPASSEGPLAGLLQAEVRGQVLAGLTRLRPLDREVLEAFYLHGLSLQEISTALDAPLGTIKRRLHTARQRLRDQLESDAGLAPCPA
jgi:RNA polymerase sigma-70 factor (ECF subfamily)